MRHSGNRVNGSAEAFRLATLDIGGGTTHLVISSFRVEGQGANVKLFPKQEFREGFNLAGDGAVYRVVREHVLEPIRDTLRTSGLGDRSDYLLNRLFGGDRGDMSVVEQLRRQQFAAQIAAPTAIGMLADYESYDTLAPTDCLREAAIPPPRRIMPLHLYRVGQRYPFRDYQATIADAKTTACVGAMLCLLGEGQLQNFNFRSDELKLQSTARFFGNLDLR